MKNRTILHTRRGMTLPEVMVAVVVLSIALVSMYQLSRQLTSLGRLSQLKAAAISIAVSQMEVIRNLPYDSVGSNATYPTGPLVASETITQNGVTFTKTININYVDDPSDGNITGTISGKPVDTAPADYKRVEVGVCWDSGSCNRPVKLSTFIAPKSLENSSNSGALFISVIDANGQPVPSADVVVTNSTVAPAVSITNHTDTNGKLQLLNLPPATGSYHVSITKSGYSSDGTLAVSGGNPNPVHPDTTIVSGSVTSATFIIDRVGDLTVQVADSQSCSALNSIQFRLRGTRLIGTTPDVYAVDQTLTTNGSGVLTVPNLPWDNYTLTMITSNLDVAGVNPPDTITINPGASVTVALAAATHQTTTLRVIVRDSGTHAPIANATVQLQDSSSFDQTITTDQGTIQQSNWIGGAGQSQVGDADKYAAKSGGISTAQAGHVVLDQVDTPVTFQEDFTTTTKKDSSASTAAWGSGTATLPQDQIIPSVFAPSATAVSTKLNSQEGLITKATLTASATLNGQTIVYSVTADGTHFETVSSGVEHTFVYPGSDLRWQAILSTTDTTVAPVVSQVDIAYHQLIMSDTTGTLTSSTFDNGQATNFITMTWDAAIPPSAGSSAVRWQVATNDDASTWNYVGPDGTSSTYFTVAGSSIPASVNGKRYLRYKLYLSTDDPSASPEVTSVSIIKNNACTPPGQAFFSPLPASGTYTLTTTRAGYQTDTRTLNISGNDLEYIDLVP